MFLSLFLLSLLFTYGTYKAIKKTLQAIFPEKTTQAPEPPRTTTVPPHSTTKPKHKKYKKNTRKRPTSTAETTPYRLKRTLRNTRYRKDWHHLKHPHYHPDLLDIQLRSHLLKTTSPTTPNPYLWTIPTTTGLTIKKKTRKRTYATRPKIDKKRTIRPTIKKKIRKRTYATRPKIYKNQTIRIKPTEKNKDKVDPAEVDQSITDPSVEDSNKEDPSEVDQSTIGPSMVDLDKEDPSVVDINKEDPSEVDESTIGPDKMTT